MRRRLTGIITMILIAASATGCAVPEVSSETQTSEADTGVSTTTADDAETVGEQVTSDGSFRYIQEDGGITLTKYIGESETVVTPKEINGIPVTAIGESAFDYDIIEIPLCEDPGPDDWDYELLYGKARNIVVSEGVTELRNHAFSNSDIVSVELPTTLVKVGEGCFRESSVERVEFKSSQPVSVGSLAFYGCRELEYISADSFGSFDWSAVRFCEVLTAVDGINESTELSGDGSLEALLFEKCRRFGAVQSGEWWYRVVDGTAEIADYTGSTEDMKIPEMIDGYTVTAIGIHALGSTDTGDGPPLHKREFGTVVIPDTVESINDCAFYESAVKRVICPTGLKKIGDQAFYSTCLELCSVPASAEVDERAFDHMTIVAEYDPIDSSLDCESILLDKAEKLHRLVTDYLNFDTEKLVYELGEPYIGEDIYETNRISSDEFSTYAEFKAMFSDSIHGDYFDQMNSDTPRLYEIYGELCYEGSMGGYLGVNETWYLGYDVEDDRIVGHFAVLEGGFAPAYESTAEYLNNENNYKFYDMIVQNIDGSYVVTGCYDTSTGMEYDYYDCHGLFYNVGFADRSLIVNEKVRPKDISAVTGAETKCRYLQPILTDTEGDEMMELGDRLARELKELYRDYLHWDGAICLEKGEAVKELELNGVKTQYEKVLDDEISTYSDLERVFTETCTRAYSQELLTRGSVVYRDFDGSLYVSDNSYGFGEMTYNTYISGYELNGDIVVFTLVNMSCSWDDSKGLYHVSEYDSEFTMTAMKVDGEWRISECDNAVLIGCCYGGCF